MNDIWRIIIDEMEQRRTLGIERYGRPLTPFNGRSGLQDLKEELLDALAYTVQVMKESEGKCSHCGK